MMSFFYNSGLNGAAQTPLVYFYLVCKPVRFFYHLTEGVVQLYGDRYKHGQSRHQVANFTDSY